MWTLICSTSRLQKSNWRNNDIQKRSGPVTLSKINTRSSTEAELVGADDVATQILWMKHFMEAQGYTIEENILHQYNKSTILLQENGRKVPGSGCEL